MARARGLGVLLFALFACLCLPAQCAPKVILFLSSAPTVRDVFKADAPALQSLITHGGVAVMTNGPLGTDWTATLGGNGYVRYPVNADGSGGPIKPDDPSAFWLGTKLLRSGRIGVVGRKSAVPIAWCPGGKLPVRSSSQLWLNGGDDPNPQQFADAVRSIAPLCAVLVVSPQVGFECQPSDSAVKGAIATEDRVLTRVRALLPTVPVISLSSGPATIRWISNWNGESVKFYPSWLAVSNLPGHLTSDTTRTKGIVSNLDVAPTLIAMVAGQAPADKVGHVIWSYGADGMSHGMPRSVTSAIRLQEALGVLESATDTTNYAIALGAIALILAGSLVSGAKGRPILKRWLQNALLLAIAAPLGVAISAWRQPDAVRVFYALAILATIGFLAAFVLLGRALAVSRDDRLLAIIQIALGAFCAFVIADVARHGMPLRLSPLSNFYQTGIRFYGLGNEYGSLFIASFTFLGLITLQRSGAQKASATATAVLGLWYAACALFIGWPALGANMGGLIVALVTGGVTWYFVASRSGVRRPWLWPALISVLCFAAVVLYDANSAHATHIGQFVSGSGGERRAAILVNKVEMNARLLIQPVAWALYALAAGFAWYWWRRLGVPRRRATEAYPWIALGVRSVLYGGVLALLTKDTGVVMLGLMAVVAIGIGVMLALQPPSLTVIPDASRK